MKHNFVEDFGSLWCSGSKEMCDNRGPGKVPDRWLLCPRKSNNLVIGKFLAFKTPLDSRYNDQIAPEHRFPPSMLFSSMKSHKVKIGLWIDLTNTSRFYNKKEIEEEGCKYVKLQCRGHGETPSEEQTRAFIEICQGFISKNPLDTIGVHCTHGFNRTGFLMISYMVEKMDTAVGVGLAEFAAARPPGIYKPDYIEELYKRYDDIADMPLPPERPDWCNEYDDGDRNDDDNGEETSDLTPEGDMMIRRRGKTKKNPMFMEDVPGVTVVKDPKCASVQRRAQEMCGWRKGGFPGSQPVSMDLKNVTLLRDKPYKVSWKADGTRYMMLIHKKNEVFFLDRDNSVFQAADISFPTRSNPSKHIEDTLLDGEMVIDKVDGKKFPRYLIYDIIRLNNVDFLHRPFYPDRYDCIKNEIIEPRYSAIVEGRINKTKEPFGIRRKEFWDLSFTESLLSEKFARKLSHEPDGLIFQPSLEPYKPGQCLECLKWKPVSHNSVDFKLKIITESGAGIVSRKVGQLFAGGMDHPFSTMKYTKAIKDLNNKIIECKFSNGQWEFMRERTDKSFPNSYNTATAVCNSIREPVTKEYLIHFIQCYQWKANDNDLMPPPKRTRT